MEYCIALGKYALEEFKTFLFWMPSLFTAKHFKVVGSPKYPFEFDMDNLV